MTDKNNILVTGGCGFIGSNLIPALEKKGYNVTVLDNLSTGNLNYIINTKARIIQADIRDDVAVSSALETQNGVIHLAARGSVIDSVSDPVENFDVNVKGTFTLLNECRKKHIKQFIFASTGGALIGNTKPPVNEQSLPRPISPYGSSKLCGEAYCSSFAHSYNMNITALRFANVIGPVSWHKKGAVTAFMKAIMNNKPITIYGNGNATRDFLYVNDLCQGIIKAYQASIPGFTPVHLAGGREVSVKELAQLICEVAGKPDHPIQYLEKRIGEVERNFAYYELAKKLFGFSPDTELHTAIKDTWNWFLEQNQSI